MEINKLKQQFENYQSQLMKDSLSDSLRWTTLEERGAGGRGGGGGG